MIKKLKREQGLSLVELVIGMVVIALMITAFTSLFMQLPDATIRNMLETSAFGLATERIEQIVADKRSSSRGYTYIDSANYPNEVPVTGMTAFNRYTTITNVEADLVTVDTIAPYPYRKVEVRVNNSVIGDIRLSLVVSDYQ